jgi:L-fuconolactonase
MIEQRLVFDALVRPQHLPPLLRVVERHPKLRVVIDHAAKPALRERRLGTWRDDLARLAAHDNVACKLSGLLTEAAPGAGLEVFAPVVETLLEEFGPQRLLWGSDWPVVDLAGGYDRWRSLTSQLLSPLAPGARAAILGTTAQRTYLDR